MPSCALRYCSRNINKTDGGITFHRFPGPCHKQREIWIRFVQKNRSEESWLPSSHTYICSLHFKTEDKYMTKTGRVYLKKSAVPYENTLFSSSKKSDGEDTNKLDRDDDDVDLVKKEPEDNDPSTSTWIASNVDPDPATIETDPIREDEFSDSDSIFDNPKEARLRENLRRKTVALKKIRRKFMNLRKKYIRLEKRKQSLMTVIRFLKQHYNKDNLRKLSEDIRAAGADLNTHEND